jgi:4-hydroxy-tetrahydrodipicolinate reductase
VIAVGVSGAAGKMGQLVAEAVDEAADLMLDGLYAPGHVGQQVAGIACVDDPRALSGCDVVVEVSRPDVVMANIDTWREQGSHTVVGTSGFDEAKLNQLRSMWGSGPPNCLVVPNFSIGAVLMMRFAVEAAAHFEGAEIVEIHDAAKVDAPSGTALATSAAMGGEVPIHSIRLPGFIADQAVILGSDGQTLTIRHHTADRRSFMPGVLASIRGVGDLPGVTVGLDLVLR